MITSPYNRLTVNMYKDDNPELTYDYLIQGEAENRENKRQFEATKI